MSHPPGLPPMAQVATWLVEHLGYPLDMGCGVDPPDVLKVAIIDYCHADPLGNIHGGTLDREGVIDFVSEEAGWVLCGS